MRKCFIHIGTHKTGSTSIQTALFDHGDALTQHGYRYPATGIPTTLAGQHNIAWQLNEDRRFDPAMGTIDDLYEEIAPYDLDVILASEDFECCPERVSAFASNLRQRGFDVIIVAFLREQAGYVRSLYLELLKHGYAEPFGVFLSEVLQHKAVHWADWNFSFCYRSLVQALTGAGTVVLRAFELNRSALLDFMSILNCTTASLGSDSDLRVNRRQPTSLAFSSFYQNRTGRPMDEERLFVARVFDNAGFEVHPENQSRIGAVFDESNRWIESGFGVHIPNNDDAKVPEPVTDAIPHFSVRNVFSDTAIRMIDDVVREPNTSLQHRHETLVDALRDR